MKTLSYSQLIEKLANIKGVTFARVTSNTDARLLKTGNPYPDARKLRDAVLVIGADYAKAIPREGERQGVNTGAFVSDPLPHGQRYLVNRKVIVSRDGNTLYLASQSTPGKRKAQPARVSYVTPDGAPIERDVIAPFIPKKSVSRKQESVGLTDEKDQIKFESLKFESIKTIRLMGETYTLTPDTVNIEKYLPTNESPVS